LVEPGLLFSSKDARDVLVVVLHFGVHLCFIARRYYTITLLVELCAQAIHRKLMCGTEFVDFLLLILS
jgi:hypothetical protein